MKVNAKSATSLVLLKDAVAQMPPASWGIEPEQ